MIGRRAQLAAICRSRLAHKHSEFQRLLIFLNKKNPPLKQFTYIYHQRYTYISQVALVMKYANAQASLVGRITGVRGFWETSLQPSCSGEQITLTWCSGREHHFGQLWWWRTSFWLGVLVENITLDRQLWLYWGKIALAMWHWWTSLQPGSSGEHHFGQVCWWGTSLWLGGFCGEHHFNHVALVEDIT